MLVTRKNGASALVPQNILYMNRFSTSNGAGRYHFTFGIQLEGGAVVELRRIQQISHSQTFSWQVSSDAFLLSGDSVEIQLKSGDILREDLVLSYYGSGRLGYPSALGAAALAVGDWVTIQYVGAAQ